MDSSIEMRATRSAMQLEELANSITHGIGLVLSIAGFVVLLVFAILRGGALQSSAALSTEALSFAFTPLPLSTILYRHRAPSAL
jgi:predicted membrane channel-forming protein YqfA (hemolysin III family)